MVKVYYFRQCCSPGNAGVVSKCKMSLASIRELQGVPIMVTEEDVEPSRLDNENRFYPPAE